MSIFLRQLIYEQIKLMFERTSYKQAVDIFLQYGVDVSKLSPEEFKKSFRKLALKYHPDRTGNDEDMKKINDAKEVIDSASPRERMISNSGHGQTTQRSSNSYNNTHNTEPWSWAGHSGGIPNGDTIYQNNFRDMNFVKKSAWEISGKPDPIKQNEFTFWNFDGKFLRASLTVFAVPETLYKISKMFSIWDGFYYSKAVIVTHKSKPNKVLLVNIKGNEVQPHIVLDHESFNMNPGNDKNFSSILNNAIENFGK